MYLVRVYQIGLLAEKTNSIIMTKRRRINFLTMLALFSSFCFIGSIFIVAVAFTSSRGYSSDAS
jgi:hypothetical protein